MLTKFANGQWFRLSDVKTVVSGSHSMTEHYVDIEIVPCAYFPTREEADAERDRIAALVNAEVNHDPVNDDQIQLLKEFAEHLAYDAGVNGSKFTSHPFGKVSLDTSQPDYLFPRILRCAGIASASDAETSVIKSTHDAIRARMS